MKYWYLKEGDILGPWTAEEIAKDNLFNEDSLVCPEDKAEQAEFWKSAQSYAQDFSALLSGDVEMDIPQEVALDDIEIDYSSGETSKEQPKEEKKEDQNPIKEEVKAESTDTPAQEIISAQETIPETKKDFMEEIEEEKNPSPILEPKTEDIIKTEEKNPFETDRPQIAPNIEETISSHTIAPRLDADGDTLLEDIPAKAILGPEAESVSTEQTDNPIPEVTLPTEDTLEDTPILNIFERPHQKTKELKDISEDIYDKYGADKEPKEDLKIKTADQSSDLERQTKNNKIYLLLIVMFVLVVIALLLTFFGNDTGKSQAVAAPVPLPQVNRTEQEDSLQHSRSIAEMPPTTDTSVIVNTSQANYTDKQRALTKVKGFILPNGKTLGEYLNNKYASYQTNWVADILSGNNYYVHFNASKIRKEPMVYSFSIDLDKNEINGLNNLGIDLLMKGE